MIRETYESPRMDFEEVKVTEAVANTCWGYHGTGKNLFYDNAGPGYTSFQIGGGKCTLNLVNVKYYTGKEDQTGTPIGPDNEKYIEMYNAIKESGGESGNPFSGEGDIVFPDGPGRPEFS